MAANRIRTYKVWVKGSKELTTTMKTAPNAELAKIRFAARMGVKSYEVEAIWQRDIPSYSGFLGNASR